MPDINKLFFPKNVTTLYKYCSTSTFKNIIENKELWFTDIGKMNDYAEEKWASKLIDKQLRDKKEPKEKDVSDDLSNFLRDNLNKNEIYFTEEYFLNYNKDWIEDERKFACCLSEDGDILSQWRAYGDDAEGFAVGFSTAELLEKGLRHNKCIPEISELKQNIDIKQEKTIYNYAQAIPYISLFKVLYNEKQQLEVILDFIKKSCVECPDKGFSIMSDFASYCIALKNPAFFEEREWRLVYPMVYQGVRESVRLPIVQNMQFIEKDGVKSPYFAFKFDPSTVTSIVLGPRNEKSEGCVKSLLQKNGIEPSKVNIKRSKATYRL